MPICIEENRLPMGAQKVHIRQITQIDRVAKAWEATHGARPTEVDVEAMFEDFGSTAARVSG